MKLYFPLLLFVLMISIYPQPKDVNGWQKLKWGMTQKSVIEQLGLSNKKYDILKDAYEIDGRKLDNTYDIVKTEIEVLGLKCSAEFYFKEERLLQVLIHRSFSTGYDGEIYHDKWKIEMINKYQKPMISKDEPIVDPNQFFRTNLKEDFWFFPSTRIILSLTTFKHSEFEEYYFGLHLLYKKNSISDEI